MSRTRDIHAEYGVLASLLTWPETFDRIGEVVREADFASARHRAIFATAASLIEAGQAVDIITVHSELARRGVKGVSLVDLNAIAQSEVSSRGARRYAEDVRRASRERELLAAADAARDIAEGEGELSVRLERMTALFSAMSQQSMRRMPRLVRDIALARIDHYMALSQGDVPVAWRTRIPTLDTLLSGGLRGGKVYVIAARPKVGKTSLAAQIAQTLAGSDDRLPTLILTQEMSAEEVTDRSVANLGRVDYGSILTGKFSDADWSGLSDGVEQLHHLPLWLDDQGGLTLADIRTKARAVKGLRVLVIDYLQLCSGSGKSQGNRNAEIEEISRGVKALATELNCVVLMLSQLNRDVERRADREPDLPDLRDSGAIEQDADAVIFLWPVRDLPGLGHRLVGCKVGANRSGPTGRFGLDFEGRYQRWAESDQDINRTASAPIARRRGFAGDDE